MYRLFHHPVLYTSPVSNDSFQLNYEQEAHGDDNTEGQAHAKQAYDEQPQSHRDQRDVTRVKLM